MLSIKIRDLLDLAGVTGRTVTTLVSGLPSYTVGRWKFVYAADLLPRLSPRYAHIAAELGAKSVASPRDYVGDDSEAAELEAWLRAHVPDAAERIARVRAALVRGLATLEPRFWLHDLPSLSLRVLRTSEGLQHILTGEPLPADAGWIRRFYLIHASGASIRGAAA